MLKVLLVSPTDPDAPSDLKFLMGGENTYTRTLLLHPPKGVEYIHYLDALKKGLISYSPIQKVLSNFVKFRILPTSAGSQCFLIKVNFDLIHCHGYSLKVVGSASPKLHLVKKKIPIVLSDSSSNYLFLRDYLNWPEWRIKAGFTIRKKLFSKLGVIDADTNWEKAKKLVIFSQFAAKIHQKLGAPGEKIEVIHPGLPKQQFKIKKRNRRVNVLFVGIWFERKGGPLLLEAFKALLEKYPNVSLTIVGPVPKKYQINNKRISQTDFVSRDKLLKEFFPQADILVLVPPKAEGYGFVVEEAASFGVPAIVSRVYALPEIVDDGKTGFVVEPGSAEDLAGKLEILIKNEDLRKKFSQATLKRFNQEFTIEKSNQKLLKVYLRACE